MAGAMVCWRLWHPGAAGRRAPWQDPEPKRHDKGVLQGAVRLCPGILPKSLAEAARHRQPVGVWSGRHCRVVIS